MEASARNQKFQDKRTHIAEPFLRTERMPHIWCPGCGIGTTVNCFAAAIGKAGIPKQDLAIVSGIGCTGRVAGYMQIDSFHTTHGRAIPFATGLALANPKLKVIVYSGDGDISAIGGNHFIHAARRNVNLTIICVNNFIYGMTGGQVAPTTPEEARASTAPYGCYEPPFNLPYLAESCGAVYVARWTSAHVRQLSRAMVEAMTKNGFTFVEAISPCPTLYGRLNRAGDGLDMMKYFRDHSEVRNQAPTHELDISKGGKIVVGKFVDKRAPTYLQKMNAHLSKVMGDKYVGWGAPEDLSGSVDQ